VISWVSSDFEKLAIQPNDFLFLDPPYSNTEAGYNAYWQRDDDVRLYTWIQKATNKGAKVCVCGSLVHNGVSCRLLDLLAKDFNLHAIQCDYNKVSRVGDKQTQEVVMLSYKVSELGTEAVKVMPYNLVTA